MMDKSTPQTATTTSANDVLVDMPVVTKKAAARLVIYEEGIAL